MGAAGQLIVGIILLGILFMSFTTGFYKENAGLQVIQLKICTGILCMGSLYVVSNLKAKASTTRD